MVNSDFQEIAHCGGKITFSITTSDGRRQYQIGFTHSSPTPSVTFGVWALPQGIAVGVYNLIGSEPPPVPGCFPVLISSDSEGMFGHQCPACNGYWRCRSGGFVCPYCAANIDTHESLTDAQRQYVAQYCQMLSAALEEEQDGEHTIDMNAVADAVGKASKKPPFYYAEQSQQNKFTCDACGQFNDVLGIFGYCSMCGTRNGLQELDASIRRLRDRINAAGKYEDCVPDAVSAFDSFAAQYAKELLRRIPMTPHRRSLFEKPFHDLKSVAERFRSAFDIDVLSGLSDAEINFCTIRFHRRHVYEHQGGEADHKYIEDSGDTTVQPKQALRETQETVHRLAGLVFRMAANLHSGFHTIFPPHEAPITEYRRRKKATT